MYFMSRRELDCMIGLVKLRYNLCLLVCLIAWLDMWNVWYKMRNVKGLFWRPLPRKDNVHLERVLTCQETWLSRSLCVYSVHRSRRWHDSVWCLAPYCTGGWLGEGYGKIDDFEMREVIRYMATTKLVSILWLCKYETDLIRCISILAVMWTFHIWYITDASDEMVGLIAGWYVCTWTHVHGSA